MVLVPAGLKWLFAALNPREMGKAPRNHPSPWCVSVRIVYGAFMSGPKWQRAEFYRQRAEMLMRQAEAASDEETHRTWVELANSWFELAKRSEALEENHLKKSKEIPK